MVLSLQSVMFALELVKLSDRRLKFILELVLLLSGKLLVFNELITCGLPLDLLLLQILSKFLLLLQKPDYSSVVELHDMIAELPCHSI